MALTCARPGGDIQMKQWFLPPPGLLHLDAEHDVGSELSAPKAEIRLRVARADEEPEDQEAILRWLRSRSKPTQPAAEQTTASEEAVLPAFNCMLKNTFIEMSPGESHNVFTRFDPTPVAAVNVRLKTSANKINFKMKAYTPSSLPFPDTTENDNQIKHQIENLHGIEEQDTPPHVVNNEDTPPHDADDDGIPEHVREVYSQTWVFDDEVVGRCLTISGLVKNPEWNGKWCFVESFDTALQRYSVRVCTPQRNGQTQWVSAKLRRVNLVRHTKLEAFSPFSLSPHSGVHECASVDCRGYAGRAEPVAEAHVGSVGFVHAPPGLARAEDARISSSQAPAVAPLAAFAAIGEPDAQPAVTSTLFATEPPRLATSASVDSRTTPRTMGVARARRLRRQCVAPLASFAASGEPDDQPAVTLELFASASWRTTPPTTGVARARRQRRKRAKARAANQTEYESRLAVILEEEEETEEIL